MASGKKQLTLIALAAILFTAVMVTGVAGNVARGNYLAIPVILCALVLAFAGIWLGFWINQQRVRLMFRDRTPDRVIANYHATLLRAKSRGIAHADAATAHLSALAAAIYGQFDRAREELAAVDWDKAPAVYRGHRLHVLALIAMLEGQDADAALHLNAKATALEQTEAAGPVSLLHDAIQVAAGAADEAALKRTEQGAGRKSGALPAVCDWALWLHFYRLGQSADADKYRERLRAAAPYFVGLGGSVSS
jgi:hypothetical protein